MKKMLCTAAVAILLCSGCIMTQSPIQGFLVTDAEVPGVLDVQKVSGKMVEGRAMASGILGVVSGDCSYEAALQDALKNSGAKKLTNIVVDYKVKNILMIFAEYTTIVRGVPVR